MNNFIDLSGKTILVTGATSGIGLEICKNIDHYNGSIIAISRDSLKLKELSSSLINKNNFKSVLFDLENIDGYPSLHKELDRPLNGIVHAAGIVKLLPIKFYNQQLQDKIRKVNYDSIANIISILLKEKKIKNQASIIFISSIAGSFGMKGNLMYSTTKSSLDIFAKVLASEVSNLKIRVNTICPGQVETPLTESIQSTITNEALEIDKKKYPLGYGIPSDVANLTLFLLSDKSRWVTGTNIPIDGGRTSIL
ncbi:MAG: SDR family oxidoreductase [Chitinophagaceae bacterium]|nr:SDR family oxidoreductase [Chitinophagaceae bacterium]